MRFHAKFISVGESGGEYFAVSFDNEDPSNNDFNLSGVEDPILLFSGSSRTMTEASATSRPTIKTPILVTSGCGLYGLRPRDSPLRSPREDHKYVEVTYDLDAKQFDEVRRIVYIIFGMQS